MRPECHGLQGSRDISVEMLGTSSGLGSKVFNEADDHARTLSNASLMLQKEANCVQA